MYVKFIRPVKGYAYFSGSVASVPDDKAMELIKMGAVYQVDKNPAAKSDLPEDFPAREILIREGLTTKKQVAAALSALADIKGIGNKTADLIKNHLINSQENGTVTGNNRRI